MLKPAENLRQLFVWKRIQFADVLKGLNSWQFQNAYVPVDQVYRDICLQCLHLVAGHFMWKAVCLRSVFYRHNSECTEALQESSSETAVLLLNQEMQGGAEESAGPADGLRHYKTRLEAHTYSQ